jgi:hypothetical protein
MALQHVKQLTALQILEAHGVIVAAADQAIAAGVDV